MSWMESLSCTLLQSTTFPQYYKWLFAEAVEKRKEEAARKHTQRGAKKLVYDINSSIFAVFLSSTRSPIPSKAPSRKQKEKNKHL